jgi:putative membrane protein
MRTKFIFAAALIVCGAIYISVAAAQSAVSSIDKSFMKDAAEGGIAEIELGQLAVDKASDPAVKRFGQRMVDDHTKANEKLKKIAAAKNVELPTEIGVKDKATKLRLEHLSGADFDKAYMSDMVSDHKSDIQAFQKESDKGQDSDVKDFVTQTLPTLQSHLKEAQSVSAKVGGKT